MLRVFGLHVCSKFLHKYTQQNTEHMKTSIWVCAFLLHVLVVHFCTLLITFCTFFQQLRQTHQAYESYEHFNLWLHIFAHGLFCTCLHVFALNVFVLHFFGLSMISKNTKDEHFNLCFHVFARFRFARFCTFLFCNVLLIEAMEDSVCTFLQKKIQSRPMFSLKKIGWDWW